jgi:hypothetical protein
MAIVYSNLILTISNQTFVTDNTLSGDDNHIKSAGKLVTLATEVSAMHLHALTIVHSPKNSSTPIIPETSLFRLQLQARFGRRMPGQWWRRSYMLDLLKMRAVQIRDLAQSKGWRFVFRETMFLHRTAIIVEKDLSEIPDRPEALASTGLKVVELNQELLATDTYDFALESRKLKAFRNLNRGYGGAALVRGNLIIGDTWYWSSESTDNPRRLHSDLRRFGFESWSKHFVYTFDIFVIPAERKGGISADFQNRAMLQLCHKGFTKGYGFYWADNIAAHWCTRVTNKWKKVRDVSVGRFLFFTWADHSSRRKAQGIPEQLPALRRS